MYLFNTLLHYTIIILLYYSTIINYLAGNYNLIFINNILIIQDENIYSVSTYTLHNIYLLCVVVFNKKKK